jgi:hypothetical protein
MARRGRLGAPWLVDAAARRAGAEGPFAVGLGAAVRRAARAGRFVCFALAGVLAEAAVARAAVLLVVEPTGARRRWLARWGRDFGSLLMMSGALVAGGVSPALFAVFGLAALT